MLLRCVRLQSFDSELNLFLPLWVRCYNFYFYSSFKLSIFDFDLRFPNTKFCHFSSQVASISRRTKVFGRVLKSRLTLIYRFVVAPIHALTAGKHCRRWRNSFSQSIYNLFWQVIRNLICYLRHESIGVFLFPPYLIFSDHLFLNNSTYQNG